MSLKNLLKLQAEMVESDVAKLAGMSSLWTVNAPPLTQSDILKLASMCDMAAEEIKIAGKYPGSGFGKDLSFSINHSPVGRIAKSWNRSASNRRIGGAAHSTSSRPDSRETSGKKSKALSAAMNILAILKSSSMKIAEKEVAETVQQLTGTYNQSQKAKRQADVEQLMNPPGQGKVETSTETSTELDVSKQAEASEFPDAVKLATARAVLAKVAETGCTCNGQGTCSYCRMKTAFARNIGGGDDEQVYNENGQEPDAASLSIRT